MDTIAQAPDNWPTWPHIFNTGERAKSAAVLARIEASETTEILERAESETGPHLDKVTYRIMEAMRAARARAIVNANNATEAAEAAAQAKTNATARDLEYTAHRHHRAAIEYRRACQALLIALRDVSNAAHPTP
jgi:transcription initiation factor TFIIIB Brf1 subunit/transcription initiation factor TFIIB